MYKPYIGVVCLAATCVASFVAVAPAPAVLRDPATAAPAPTFDIDLRDAPDIDLRDAPVRQTLEMVFAVERDQYSIQPEVSGYLSLRATGATADKIRTRIAEATVKPLQIEYTDRVFVVRAGGAATQEIVSPGPPSVAKPAKSRPAYSQQVVGVLLARGESAANRAEFFPAPRAQALLVTGSDPLNAYCRVVRVGDHVEGSESQRIVVSEINAGGVVLLNEATGASVRVALRNMPAS